MLDVVTSLPTHSVGCRITYDNKVWTWDSARAECSSNESWIRLDPSDYVDSTNKYRIYKIIDFDLTKSYGFLSLTIQIKGDYNYPFEGEWRLSISKHENSNINVYLTQLSPRLHLSLYVYLTADGVFKST